MILHASADVFVELVMAIQQRVLITTGRNVYLWKATEYIGRVNNNRIEYNG